MNILNTLTALKISSEPFFPKEIKKEKSKFTITEKSEHTKNQKTTDLNNNSNLGKTEEFKNDNLISSSSVQPKDDVTETISKIQKISKGEIKEYIPKKFKLVNKEK
jgi:hypothetical protein